MDIHKEIVSHHFGAEGAPKNNKYSNAGGLGYGGFGSLRQQKYSAGGGHGGGGGGGHHGGGGGHHGGGGGGRGWRGRGGYGYPYYGGYYGYPYYWDYPYAETVLLTDGAVAPAAVAKPKEEPKKDAATAAPVATTAKTADVKKSISNMNYLLGGAAGGVAGYFIAAKKGGNGVGGAAIGIAVVIGGMMAVNQLSK